MQDDPYLDRMVSPSETLTRARGWFEQCGITRVADQTGLDIVGIPTFAAFRPNAETLSVSQGKGLTRDAARASAVMEAIEFAVAESPMVPAAMLADLEATSGDAVRLDVSRWLPEDHDGTIPDITKWVVGHAWLDDQPSIAPLDAVDLSGRAQSLKGICKSTNGLASGNTRAEAYFHGLCELIERDAHTHWMLRDESERQATLLHPDSFEDLMVRDLLGRIREAGPQVRLYELSNDIGVPVIVAYIFEEGQSRSHSAWAAGYGAHPVAARAAIRALTEAAQSRITGIAGARDDIPAERYKNEAAAPQMPVLRFRAPRTIGLAPSVSLNGMINYLEGCLWTAGVTQVFSFPLTPDEADLAVVKVVAPELEDMSVNPYWRPGHRTRRGLAA